MGPALETGTLAIEVAVPSTVGILRLPISEFAVGVAQGKLTFTKEWEWSA